MRKTALLAICMCILVGAVQAAVITGVTASGGGDGGALYYPEQITNGSPTASGWGGTSGNFWFNAPIWNTSAWYEFDLGGTYDLDTMDIINGGQPTLEGRSLKTVDIQVSSDGGATYTDVHTAIDLTIMPTGYADGDTMALTDTLAMGGVTADHVRINLYAPTNGGTHSSGNVYYLLNEVRFVDTTLPILSGCCYISDLSVFASQWLDDGLVGEDCVAPPEWDLNDDCSVSFSDFAVIAKSWLWACRETFEELMAKGHPTLIPTHRLSEQWWADRHQEILDRVQQGNVDIIFLGDSITHGWIWCQNIWGQYFGTNAVNMGFGGDGTQHALWRIENGEVDGISPDVAVVNIGHNNTPSGSPQQIGDAIKAICLDLREKLPDTEILLLGIFPAREPDDPIRETITQTNIIASEIAHCEMIHYLDIGDQFLLPDGSVDPALMSDLIHPTGAGYQVWAEAMAPLLAELMD